MIKITSAHRAWINTESIYARSRKENAENNLLLSVFLAHEAPLMTEQ